MTTLTEHEEKIYKAACDALQYPPDYLTTTQKTFCEIIQTFGKGIKRGDRYYRKSSNKELNNLTEVLKALKDDDLIVEPLIVPINAIGG